MSKPNASDSRQIFPELTEAFSLKRARFYGAGLLISSFGTLTYAATLPALLFKSGVNAFYIGLLIGVMRLTTFLVNLSLGHIGDVVSTKKVMIYCELGAAVASTMILLSWCKYGSNWLVPFFIANNFRVIFTSLQAGSVQKHGKMFDNALKLNGRFAVTLNGVNNGALFLGGVLAVVYFNYLSIPLVVVVDALTFIINGLLILLMQKGSVMSPHKDLSVKRPKIKTNFHAYYKSFPALMLIDVLLSLALCGSNTLNLRLLQYHAELIPLMPALFGGAAFLTSFGLDRKFSPNSKVLWVTYAFTLLIQGVFVKYPIIVIAVSLVRNAAYWIIFHAISRDLMSSAPVDSYSSIAAGRNAINIGVLASGEIWVGASKQVPIVFEMLWRSVVASVVPIKGIFLKERSNAPL